MTPRGGEPRVAWLTGGIGQGKTRLLRGLERAAVAAGRTCVYVPIPTLDPACLTTWCLDQLGLPDTGGIAALHDAARRGFCVLVDDAERLPAESRALLVALAGRTDTDVRVVFASAARAPEDLPAGSRWSLDDERILERSHRALGIDPNAAAGEEARPTPPLQPEGRPDRTERTEAGANRAAARAEHRPARWPLWLATGAAVLWLGVFLTRESVPGPETGRPDPASQTSAPEARADRAPPRAGGAQRSPSASPPSERPVRPTGTTRLPERAEPPPVLPAEVERSPSVAERAPPATDRRQAPLIVGVAAVPPLIAGTAGVPPLTAGTAGVPPPVAAPPPVQPAGRTRIIVNAIPAALVEIDGFFIGETPIADLELEPGPHRVVAEFEDGTKVERRVAVSGDVMLLVFP